MKIDSDKIMKAVDLVASFSASGSAMEAAYKSVVFEKVDEHSMSVYASNHQTAGRVSGLYVDDWGSLPERFLLDTGAVQTIIKNTQGAKVEFNLDEKTNQIVVNAGATFQLNYRVNADGLSFGEGLERQVFSSRQLIPFLAKLKLFTSNEASQPNLAGVNLSGNRFYAFAVFNGMRVDSEIKAISESLTFLPDVIINGITAFSPEADSEFAFDGSAIYFYQGSMAFRSVLLQSEYPSAQIDASLDNVMSSEYTRVSIRTAELKELVSRSNAFKLTDESKVVKLQYHSEDRLVATISDSTDNQRITQTVMNKGSERLAPDFSVKVRVSFLDSLVKVFYDHVEISLIIHGNVIVVKGKEAWCFSSVVQ